VLRSLFGGVAAATAVVCLGATAAYAVTPAPDCHGYAITDPNGDQFVGARLGDGYPHVQAGPQIDIEGVFFLVDGSGTLSANIQVANLPAVPDFEGAFYEVRWQAPFGFGYIGLAADRDAAGDFYSYRTYDSATGSWRGLRRAKGGSVHLGAHGVIQIQIPDDATWSTSFSDLRAVASENRVYDPILGGDQLSTDRAEDFFYSHGAC